MDSMSDDRRLLAYISICYGSGVGVHLSTYIHPPYRLAVNKKYIFC